MKKFTDVSSKLQLTKYETEHFNEIACVCAAVKYDTDWSFYFFYFFHLIVRLCIQTLVGWQYSWQRKQINVGIITGNRQAETVGAYR